MATNLWHVAVTYSASGGADGPQLGWNYSVDNVEAETAEEAIRIVKRELRRAEPTVYQMSAGAAVPAALQSPLHS